MEGEYEEMSGWESVRQQVLERDSYRCQTCLVNKATDVHHLIPRKSGGMDILDNLTSQCERCHYSVIEINKPSNPYHVKMLKVKDVTHERLNGLGSRRETFDEIINRLISFWEENHK